MPDFLFLQSEGLQTKDDKLYFPTATTEFDAQRLTVS